MTAKLHIGLFQEILARYDIQPGSTLLDPMAGSGTCLLACLQGINVIANEMEEHFIEPMAGFHCDGTFPGWEIVDYYDWYSDIPYPSRCHHRLGQHKAHWIKGSWDKIRQNGPMLGYQMGQALIIRGDARMLPLASADSIITSPPYEASPVADARHLHFDDRRRDLSIENKKEYGVPTGYTRPKDGLPSGGADAIVTSPPYEGTEVARSTTSEGNKAYRNGQWKGDLTKDWGLERGYTRPDAIITSPPYESAHIGGPDTHPEKMVGSENGLCSRRYTDVIVTSPPYADMADAKRHPGDGLESEKGHVLGYTRPDVVVTSPPYENINNEYRQFGGLKDPTANKSGGIGATGTPHKYTRPDVVVTSPPYEQCLASGGNKPTPHDTTGFHKADYDTKVPYELRGALMINAGIYDQWKQTTNIGNLRGKGYWESMCLVYRECHRVLKDAGLMVLILKGYTRDKKYVDLPQQTVDMVESCGFKLIDQWERELWSLSFWRILQKRNNPDGFDERLRFETVLGFRKEA